VLDPDVQISRFRFFMGDNAVPFLQHAPVIRQEMYPDFLNEVLPEVGWGNTSSYTANDWSEHTHEPACCAVISQQRLREKLLVNCRICVEAIRHALSMLGVRAGS
jgi:hypothetical protein